MPTLSRPSQRRRFWTGRLLAVLVVLVVLASAIGVAQGASAGSTAEHAGAAQVAPSVFLNAEYADRPVEPTAFGPDKGPGDFLEAANYVEHIQWSSWGQPQAVGTGQIRLLTDATSTSPVAVTLGGLVTCAGQLIYTTYSLALAPGAARPKFWPAGQTGSFPCHITTGGFNPNDRGEHREAARGSCTSEGLGVPGRSETVTWTPALPRSWHGPGMCATDWADWGSAVATGRGVMRNGFTQWGAKTVVSAPAWCRGEALAYTSLVMTLYGKGETLRVKGNVSKRDAQRLRSEIDRPGVPTRVYRQSLAGCYPVTAAATAARSAAPHAHAASRAVAAEAARDASYLEGRIRGAASRRGPQTIVKVLHGCCGVVALEVYERSRPGRTARFGVYGLTVVTSPHMIDQVKVFEDKTHGPYHLGEAIASQLYNFEIAPGGNARPHEGNWVVGVSHPFHADDGWTTGRVAYHYEEAEMTAAELQVLYGQALSVLNKAESHAPVSQEAVLAPGLPCGLPEYQACEPGGRW